MFAKIHIYIRLYYKKTYKTLVSAKLTDNLLKGCRAVVGMS